MKIGFILKDIKIGDKANIGEVNIQVQYSAGELVGEYELFKRVIKEVPEVVADLGEGAIAFEKMDKAFNDISTARCSEENAEEVKKSAVNKVMDVVNSLRNANAEQRPDNNQAV